MDDKQAMHAMSIDDAYHVERTLDMVRIVDQRLPE